MEWQASDILGTTVNTEDGELRELRLDAGPDNRAADVIEHEGAGALRYAVQWDIAPIDTELQIIAVSPSVDEPGDVEVFVFTL